LTRLAPWPVRFIDPAPAIARRALELMRAATSPLPDEGARILFTSGRPPSPALSAVLAGFGLGELGARRFDTPPLSA
jgi:glutamate racemase